MFLFRQSLRRCFPLLPALPVVTMDSDTAVTFGTMDSDTAVTFVRPPWPLALDFCRITASGSVIGSRRPCWHWSDPGHHTSSGRENFEHRPGQGCSTVTGRPDSTAGPTRPSFVMHAYLWIAAAPPGVATRQFSLPAFETQITFESCWVYRGQAPDHPRKSLLQFMRTAKEDSGMYPTQF